jgi:hypothetical protein
MACGGGNPNPQGSDAGSDVASKFDAHFAVDADAVDAGPDVVPLEAGPPCVEGNFYLDMTNDAGTTTLTSGCGDAGAPGVAFDMNCMDCQNVGFSACGGGQMIRGGRLTTDPVGTFSGTEIDRTDTDGGICQFNGTLTIFNWADAGGTVQGSYASYWTGPCTTNPSPISGHFCLQRQ